ncbi:hypothetical protein BGZ83_008743 [Gryganskiella cystojenkinii]|nr:hypothetical protein BGZ83_008743 [Gryganskiella cystojenkinii]
MFTPRKNRNIRKKIEFDNEDVETPATVSATPTATINDSNSLAAAGPSTDAMKAASVPAKVKKVKKKVPSTVLSFGDEEQNAEDEFKVKKSSASRRLANRSKEPTAIMEADYESTTSRATTANSNSYSKEALEELRNSTLSTTPVTKSHHNTDESLVEEKFPSLLGGRAIVPDEDAVYFARKKREQMRLRNDFDEAEFISLAGGDDDTVTEERDTRLVREEDDDMDDGEADLDQVMGEKLALGNKAQRMAERNKRSVREEMLADMIEDGEDEEDTREWEMQQIRNAGVVKTDSKNPARPSRPVHRSIAFPEITQVPKLSDVKNRLKMHMDNLKQQKAMHEAQLKQLRHEEADLTLGVVDAEEDMKKASARYTFFQELRSYCRNLAAFFEEKFPELETIERDYRHLLSSRTKLVVDRRRQELKDDLAQFANVVQEDENSNGGVKAEGDEFGRSIAIDPFAARKRRQAERLRRQAARRAKAAAKEPNESAALELQDGLSTDDELGAGDDQELCEAVTELEERQIAVFKEVGTEYTTLAAVKKRFLAWKSEYHKDYNKAFGGLLLPMVFDFYIRQETCLWNPLRVTVDLSEQTWHKEVSSYTVIHLPSRMHSDSESDQDDEDEEEDMDQDLMSKVVSKSLCPRLTQFLKSGGVDLYSAKQTRCLKAILDQLLDYVDKKENKMDQLLKATLAIVLETAQAHREQFVQAAQPLTPRHILTTEGQEAREKYLWKTIGLFRNLMQLRRFVPAGQEASILDTPVVDGLLHDCILRLLEGDEKDTTSKYQMIFHALPHALRSQERHLIIDRMAKNL